MNRRLFPASIFGCIAAAWLGLPSGLHAQLPVQSTEAHRIEGETVIEWFGYQGRTYFIQVSDASDPLRKWTWAPVIEAGNDGLISYEFGGNSPSGFARLHYTDTPKPEGVTYEAWDADRDGLSNVDELSATPQSDPLKADTDGDGLPDGWERLNGLNPVDNGSTSGSDGWIGDADGDGASNGREMEELTEANNANSFPPDFWGVRNHI